MKKISGSPYLFLLVALLHLFALSFLIEWLSFVTKPLILPSLVFHLVLTLKKSGQNIPKLLLTALLFSWLGDIALMLTGYKEWMFMAGIGFFMIAQLAYMIIYYKAVDNRNVTVRRSFIVLMIQVVVVIYVYLLWTRLYPASGGLAIPVTVYSVAILGMVLSSLQRYNKTTPGSFILVAAGAVLFLISDSLIAVNKFLNPVTLERLWIMITYILAQWLIVTGLLEHFRKEA